MTKKSQSRLERDRIDNMTVRKKEEIDSEYGQTCALVGDLHFRIELFKKQIEEINTQMQALERRLVPLNVRLFELNREYAKSKLEVKEEEKEVLNGELVTQTPEQTVTQESQLNS